MFALAPPHDGRLDELPVYLDVVDLPLDEGPEHTDVADDSVWSQGELGIRGGPLQLAPARNAKAPPKAKHVPFYRAIGAKSKADGDVVAVKRALAVWARSGAHHPEWYPWQRVWSTRPGSLFIHELGHFQKRHNLPVTHRYDHKTHDLLAPFFDAYGIRLLADYPHVTPQQRFVAEMMWGYHNRARIHYAQWRPIDGHDNKHKLDLYTDCSGWVTDGCEWGGLHDPNAFGFNGFGYTGTQIAHGRRVSLVEAEAADLAFYGLDPGGAPHHVTGVVSRTRCVSHGTESGPSLLALGPAIGGALLSIHRYL